MKKALLALVPAWLAALIVLLAWAPAATAQQISPEWAQAMQWRMDTVQVLSARNDADALYAAAILEASAIGLDPQTGEAAAPSPTAALGLLDRAAALDPDAADIATAALRLCADIETCDLTQRRMALLAVAPHNAFAWVPALRQSREHEDSQRVTSILQHMAAAERFDSWWIASATRLQRGLAQAPLRPLDLSQGAPWVRAADDAMRQRFGKLASDTHAWILAMTFGMPSYSALAAACKTDNPAFAVRQIDCRRIGLLLEQQGTSVIANRIGLVLHRRAALDATDLEAALAAERRIDWQFEAFRDQIMVVPDFGPDVTSLTPAQKQQLFDWLDTMATSLRFRRQQGSELGAIRVMLRQAGIPLEPPADWIDQQQQRRRQREQARHAQADVPPLSPEPRGRP